MVNGDIFSCHLPEYDVRVSCTIFNCSLIFIHILPLALFQISMAHGFR